MSTPIENQTSLVIIGTGIKFLSHLTIEAQSYIKNSDVVLYLINDGAMQVWIQKNSKYSESLDNFYQRHNSRYDSYCAMANYILSFVEKRKRVCVAIYGHPTKFALPAVKAAEQAQKKNIEVKIIPGISADDCLFADLAVNPSSEGYHSYEASEFLLYNRVPDLTTNLLLWQVGIIGMLDYPKDVNKEGFNVLIKYLRNFYCKDHTIILYEAAQYPLLTGKILKTTLEEVSLASITKLTTLYIPYAKKRELNVEILDQLTKKL